MGKLPSLGATSPDFARLLFDCIACTPRCVSDLHAVVPRGCAGLTFRAKRFAKTGFIFFNLVSQRFARRGFFPCPSVPCFFLVFSESFPRIMWARQGKTLLGKFFPRWKPTNQGKGGQGPDKASWPPFTFLCSHAVSTRFCIRSSGKDPLG